MSFVDREEDTEEDTNEVNEEEGTEEDTDEEPKEVDEEEIGSVSDFPCWVSFPSPSVYINVTTLGCTALLFTTALQCTLR